MRVHTNIGVYPNRSLLKQFSGATKAIGTSAPTTHAQAMGYSGQNGIVSFIFLDGGTANVTTIWEWHQGIADLNSGNGWVGCGANATENQKSVDQLTKASFQISENVEFFIQTTTAVTSAFVSGTESGNNANTDNTKGKTR